MAIKYIFCDISARVKVPGRNLPVEIGMRHGQVRLRPEFVQDGLIEVPIAGNGWFKASGELTEQGYTWMILVPIQQDCTFLQSLLIAKADYDRLLKKATKA